MAKDIRVINGSIRLSKKRGLFGPDQQDELEAAATPEELARLSELGHIEGFGTKKAEKAEPEKPKK